MSVRHPIRLAALLSVPALLASACGVRDLDSLGVAPFSTDPAIFDDNFGDGVDFQAFLGSKYDAISIDSGQKHEGTASLKVIVPVPDPATGTYAGGAFTSNVPRDLSGYNALTFWAKAQVDCDLDIAGFGNDNTGTSKYTAAWGAIPVSTEWDYYVIPIPLPARLSAEQGLFFFAEGAEGGVANVLWFDQITFTNVDTISDPRPSMPSRSVDAFVGETITVTNVQTIFEVGGQDEVIGHQPGYFTFVSSDPAVAAGGEGSFQVVGAGNATITARLGEVDATGTVTLEAVAIDPAPTPTLPAADVISLFSNAYTNRPVDTWSADWDRADVEDRKIGDDDIKAYTDLVYAGIEFPPIDATGMQFFHIDVWIAGIPTFSVKLVDFGADGVYGGTGVNRDTEHKLSFNPSTDPAVVANQWVGLDLPLSRFTGLASRAHLAQLLLEGPGNPPIAAYVDNIYFHR